MKTIGIIGGKGRMGTLFSNILKKSFNIIVSDNDSTNIDLVKKSDIIIFSVPISITVKTIESVLPYTNPKQLLMDFTSIKQEPIKAMLKSESAVVGMHPMFGPGITELNKQTIILCPARPDAQYESIKSFLIAQKANLIITIPKKHDKMMSIIQGMLHFSSIAMCHAIKELGIDVKESLKFTSPIYKLRMDMIGRILNQDPNLYADIELSNPSNIDSISTYLKTCEKLLNIIKTNNKSEFIQYFKEASDYLGDFTEEAQKESDNLIKKMIK